MIKIVIIIATFCIAGLSTDLSGKIGFEFGLFSPMFPSKSDLRATYGPGTEIGIRYHFNKTYSTQLSGAWIKAEGLDNVNGGRYNLFLNLDQSFYLPPISKLDHMIFWDTSIFSYHDIYGATAVGYGMQYMLNDNIAIIGKIGGGFEWLDWTWETKKSLGIIMYLK